MRFGRAYIIILTFLCLGGIFSPRAQAQTPSLPIVVEADESGLILTWTPPAVELATFNANRTDYSMVQLAGLPAQGAPGRPELPFFSQSIGLPSAGDVRFRILELQRDMISLPHLPLPAPTPQPLSLSQTDPADPALFGRLTRIEPDPTVYARDRFYPAAAVELGAPYRWRNWRFAALRLYPVRVNPITRQAEVIRFLRLEIIFDEPASPSLSGQAGQGPLARALAGALLNPAALQWATAARAAPQSQAVANAAPVEPLTKIIVDQAGLYAVTYNDLQSAGVAVDSLDPRTLQLSYGPSFQPVAVTVEGETDGSFDPGDRLLFYAEPTFSRFTDRDVYFLSHNHSQSPRIQPRSANPQGLTGGAAWATSRAEANQIYESLYPGRDGDYWYWRRLRRPDISSLDFSMSLVQPATGAPDASLTIWVQGESDPLQTPDHFMQVKFNGQLVGSRQWNGAQYIAAQVSVPASLLKAGTNQINLTLPGLPGVTIEQMLVDAMQLRYAVNRGGTEQLIFDGESGQKSYTLSGWTTPELAVYDVTDSAAPRQLFGYHLAFVNGSYQLTIGDAGDSLSKYLVAPKDRLKTPFSFQPVQFLNEPAAGAEYIIITHPDFAGAINALAAHREAKGLQVFTADINAIYDTYGGGRITPAAVRTFLQHAYQTWPTPPLYVLLVGDGSYDFKNYSGFNPKTFVPPLLAQVDPWWGETAADNRLATFDLAQMDFPSMVIGRLPVNSAAETATVVNKIIEYETDPFPGGWNARHLFVSGDALSGNPRPSAQDFMNSAEEAASKLTAPYTAHRFFYDPQANGEVPYVYNNHDTLRASFLSAWNYGASMITFHGHSSWHQWNVDPLLRWSLDPANNDVLRLTNDRRLPVVIGMTCFTGFFHHPRYPTLDESLLRQSGGGAVAVWGSTGLGVATGHEALQEGFYAAITGGQTNLGAAVLAGKLQLYSTGLNQDLLNTFTLLGDPALTLDFTIVPFTEHKYLPFIAH